MSQFSSGISSLSSLDSDGKKSTQSLLIMKNSESNRRISTSSLVVSSVVLVFDTIRNDVLLHVCILPKHQNAS